MRISAGRYKGRILAYPKAGLRPTKVVTRQAMFNMLGVRVRGAKVCDLFAGGGSLGIEALSRGAASAVFVEQSGPVLGVLRSNTADLPGTEVRRGDVLRVLKRLAGAGFDLVFADPPYMNGLVQVTIEVVVQFEVLRPGGWLVIEHHRREMPVVPSGWETLKQGSYGDSIVTILRRPE